MSHLYLMPSASAGWNKPLLLRIAQRIQARPASLRMYQHGERIGSLYCFDIAGMIAHGSPFASPFFNRWGVFTHVEIEGDPAANLQLLCSSPHALTQDEEQDYLECLSEENREVVSVFQHAADLLALPIEHALVLFTVERWRPDLRREYERLYGEKRYIEASAAAVMQVHEFIDLVDNDTIARFTQQAKTA